MTAPAANYDNVHATVMKTEAVDFLRPRPGGRYLDGTLGMGGHSRELLSRVNGQAQLLGLDRDRAALAMAGERLAEFGDAAILRYSAFADFEIELDALGWDTVDGALLDVGVSSLQLDNADRGFSFLADGPLDMRMDTGAGAAPARNLVNQGSFERLKIVIRDLGEEPMAGRIARAIIAAREEEPIETTLRLAKIVEAAYPAKWRRTARNHPATRTFQALRLEVNDELGQLRHFLERITDRLAEGGRVVVISFHSLEDRLVKRAFRERAKPCTCPPRQLICTCSGPSLKLLTKKPMLPSDEEQAANPRSRSAKLRAAEKLPAPKPPEQEES